ncbi:MAG: hypothetical protein V8R80_00595 [Eubacterium sp.]
MRDRRVASYGSALRSAAEVNLGEGTYQIFVGLDTGYPVKQSMSYRDQKAYEWYQKISSYTGESSGHHFYGARNYDYNADSACFPDRTSAGGQRNYPVAADGSRLRFILSWIFVSGSE